jgi:hypothetical protein
MARGIDFTFVQAPPRAAEMYIIPEQVLCAIPADFFFSESLVRNSGIPWARVEAAFARAQRLVNCADTFREKLSEGVPFNPPVRRLRLDRRSLSHWVTVTLLRDPRACPNRHRDFGSRKGQGVRQGGEAVLPCH